MTWSSPQPRQFCEGQDISESEAKEVLDLLSRWMSKVMRLSKYQEALDQAHKICAYWIKESAERPMKFDFVESDLEKLIWLSSITRSTASNSAASSQVPMEGIIESAATLPRKPPQLPKGDCRFITRKQDRVYKCDWCVKTVKFNTKVRPFLGNYIRKTWTCSVAEEEQLWKDGQIDATFYCLTCLAWYYNVDEFTAQERYLSNETTYRQLRSQKLLRMK